MGYETTVTTRKEQHMTQASLARKLRLLRAERKLSLRQAARLTGLAKETVSDLERGRRHPNDVTLAKIAEAYGISVEELFDLEESGLSGKAPAPSFTPEATEEERRIAWVREYIEVTFGHLDLEELNDAWKVVPEGPIRDTIARLIARKGLGQEAELSAKSRERRERNEATTSSAEEEAG